MTEHEREIAALVREHAEARFDDRFSDRVLARLARERGASVSAALQRQFMRVVPFAAAASIALAAYNLWAGYRSGASGIDAILNLPQVTLASAYSPTALYGAVAGNSENP